LGVVQGKQPPVRGTDALQKTLLETLLAAIRDSLWDCGKWMKKFWEIYELQYLWQGYI